MADADDTQLSNRRELEGLAAAHCILPMTPVNESWEQGPVIYAKGAGAELVDSEASVAWLCSVLTTWSR